MSKAGEGGKGKDKDGKGKGKKGKDGKDGKGKKVGCKLIKVSVGHDDPSTRHQIASGPTRGDM